MPNKSKVTKLDRSRPKKSARAAPAGARLDNRAQHLIELSADWYWEQDAQFRFTRIDSRGVAAGEGPDGENIVGKRRWEIGLDILAPGGWLVHRALLDECQSFR